MVYALYAARRRYSGYGTAVADQADETDEASPETGVKSAADSDAKPTAAEARELADRLADVHRRTEELAARVATFQAATTELADTVNADQSDRAEPGAEINQAGQADQADQADQAKDIGRLKRLRTRPNPPVR